MAALAASSGASASAMPEWQQTIRARMVAQQLENDVYKEVFDDYKRLARTARELKARNAALLKGGAGSSAGDGPSPLIQHLETELSSLRSELSQLYRTQAAAQNRQLTLSDALRDRDEEVRGLKEEVRDLRERGGRAEQREKGWEERWRQRGKDMETLNDELISQNIEISALTQRNQALQADNASLLQRWIDKMNLTADEMNAEFEKEQGQGQGLGPELGDGAKDRLREALEEDGPGQGDVAPVMEAGTEATPKKSKPTPTSMAAVRPEGTRTAGVQPAKKKEGFR